MRFLFRPHLLHFVLIISFLLSTPVLYGQKKQKSPEKQQKEFLKLQDERDQNSDEKLKEDRKKHESIQTKETRKRMKSNKKRSVRMQGNKHESNFIQRMFTRKPKGR